MGGKKKVTPSQSRPKKGSGSGRVEEDVIKLNIILDFDVDDEFNNRGKKKQTANSKAELEIRKYVIVILK